MARIGYLMTMVKAVEVIAGFLLLTGRQVPLALTLLAPVLVNIFTFHLFLAPAGLALPIVLTVLEIVLAFAWREAFLPMLRTDTHVIQRRAQTNARHDVQTGQQVA